ncbi:hypothetical protein ACHRV1_12795 [Flavobacterium aquidurense]|jgi:hypothetical protein|uniref:hypothetical protein n=1 Tax=Flavobacterium aquidurense TaxID=362413 RepID=UPI00375647BA
MQNFPQNESTRTIKTPLRKTKFGIVQNCPQETTTFQSTIRNQVLNNFHTFEKTKNNE